MAETATEYAARVAEKKRVDAEYATKVLAYKAANSKNAATQKLTPDEITHQQTAIDAQKAANLRQNLTQQYAPQPVQNGLQALTRVLSGQQPTQPKKTK